MRKLISFCGCVLVILLSLYTTAYAASVLPQTFPGNDSNSYTPPEGCIHYEIPNSSEEGTHTVTFDETGTIDPNGAYSFTVVVGTEEGEDFTKVLSWSSNFPIYAVIVKGGNAFNLYQYDIDVRGDTDLVSPDNESGHPANVSHVSIVICPEDFPPDPPTPSCPPCPTCPPCPPCPPSPPCPPTNCCIIGFFIIFILLIIVFFLLGLFTCRIFNPCCWKHRHKRHCGGMNLDNDPNMNIPGRHNGDHKENCKNGQCGQDHKNGPPPAYTRKDYYNNY